MRPLLLRALSARAEVCEADLFGSQAAGAGQRQSDVDIAVYVDPSARPGEGFGYAAALSANLMAAAGTNAIGVVVLNGASPVLYHRVLRDGRRILSRDLRATTTREGYALPRYCDFLPQLAKIESVRRNRLSTDSTSERQL